jgi:hypothetical protein
MFGEASKSSRISMFGEASKGSNISVFGEASKSSNISVFGEASKSSNISMFGEASKSIMINRPFLQLDTPHCQLNYAHLPLSALTFRFRPPQCDVTVEACCKLVIRQLSDPFLRVFCDSTDSSTCIRVGACKTSQPCC